MRKWIAFGLAGLLLAGGTLGVFLASRKKTRTPAEDASVINAVVEGIFDQRVRGLERWSSGDRIALMPFFRESHPGNFDAKLREMIYTARHSWPRPLNEQADELSQIDASIDRRVQDDVIESNAPLSAMRLDPRIVVAERAETPAPVASRDKRGIRMSGCISSPRYSADGAYAIVDICEVKLDEFPFSKGYIRLLVKRQIHNWRLTAVISAFPIAIG